MKPLMLEEVVTALEGTIDRPMPVGRVTRVASDSRAIQAGDLFVAIRGPNFDGHGFVGEALVKGALAAVVNSDFAPAGTDPVGLPPGAVLIRVDDTVSALGRLARWYRRTVIGGSVTVIAVTGSNGKTTTKTMIAHVLSGRWKGRGSIKSFNNRIGVPLTLLSTEPDEEFVVCEVGTNAPGEIAALARLVEPEIAVVTGIAPVHLEGLGSLEGIAVEKLSLLTELRPDGCALINADSELLRWLLEHDRQYARVKKVMFGEWPEADLRLTGLKTTELPSDETHGLRVTQEFKVNDRFVYRLNVPGRHNVFNALAAIGVARRFGMTDDQIARRLATFELPPMRLDSQRVGSLTLINDAYNANPASMAAAVDVLVSMPASGRRVLVVGDMHELGPAAADLHREVASRIGQSAVDVVIAVGEYSRLVRQAIKESSRDRVEVHAYATTDLARRRLGSLLRPGDTMLVKGSRAMALEKLVEAARKWAKASPRRQSSKQSAVWPGARRVKT
ncbi:MAG TPA: UDP-N-acetylmuramoyl-tripeptide--D-alanyl-D-alanine ligase [Phycisphaerae bacterium]|nr:UDP-N-acetylmuramoyl-tripeptide--D-alanyl-D-alanine ligase [Phycisphaerae bacterium]